MKITEDTYYAILNACAEHSSETGGIIGGKNKIVSKFEFDEGTLLSSEQHYYPNVEKRAERSAQKAKLFDESYTLGEHALAVTTAN